MFYGLTTAASESLGQRHSRCGHQLSQGRWSSETLCHVVSTGARLRDEGRDQDQESPYVGERIRHLDQSRTVEHNRTHDGDHELQMRDGQSWPCTDVLSMFQKKWHRSTAEADVFTATFETKVDPGIFYSWLRHRKWHTLIEGKNSWNTEKCVVVGRNNNDVDFRTCTVVAIVQACINVVVSFVFLLVITC